MSAEDINNTIFKLKKALKEPLPGIIAQKRMMPEIHSSHLEYFSDKPLRKAAVLISLFPFNGHVGTLFIERTQDTSPHSGQIAFPGGRFEPNDNTLINTAIREANEEIGINPDEVEIIGSLTPIEIPISGFSVTPIIGVLQTDPKIKPCPTEVQNYFKVTLKELLNTNNKTTGEVPVRNKRITTPYYKLKHTIIWGATAMVLSEFEEIFSKAKQ
ncbi:MAG TPA: CoA pyrophosphatase [Bacteroidales bacterium]|jgi:8-oxo-dGTP pyrophosphatase MutT (NUDIX family)|nr:CoA pyrophosphatase [Bacteroidales bacterium]MDD4236818.1 CoA pyrophosphatase [Bacteroidales bacterium]HRW21334.1 CoA pyrophosphatase [Bacteroidales bacterium]HXK82664.1 CoA pyrophosphatase [Bacteroidales bacterium]